MERLENFPDLTVHLFADYNGTFRLLEVSQVPPTHIEDFNSGQISAFFLFDPE